MDDEFEQFLQVSPSYFFDSLLNSEEDESSADFMRAFSYFCQIFYAQDMLKAQITL